MKNTFVKIRIADQDKKALEAFAQKCSKSVAEIIRTALSETMRGQIAGQLRRESIAQFRRSTNLLLALFEARPIDVPKLREVARQVCVDAGKVLK